MARKNLIEVSTPLQLRPETGATTGSDRPIAGLTPQMRAASPVGGITKTLGNITEKVERAQDLERQLAAGQMIVEIDPALIDGSFVKDRLEIDPADLSMLVEQIREHGQQVPILVRPHPESRGRYQVAYGHRRLAAARQLGSKVRAVVRELTDDQLVVSQGQENNARANLSYIERALFAQRLEERAFGRETIMAALGVDKQALSKMLIVMRQVPLPLIMLIGSAPDIGRRRWMEFGERLESGDPEVLLAALSSADDLKALPSNERFQRALLLASAKAEKAKFTVAESRIGNVPVTFKRIGSKTTFVFDGKAAPGFDDYVQRRLDSLYKEFKQETGD
ncbi:plasmid partitioning protein RepB [Metarhizobium album]|uniref:Plasmid partitioning protein RepB n=1 Tax=Metarhizobium album TaxID=2182425 RepID=A0A2U2DL76_9HYPH|nr:plasmid partitioning protein RepB [Rhizobium album]PWE54055.1 plasmid partitioning protein RepB [Rhizobium album]